MTDKPKEKVVILAKKVLGWEWVDVCASDNDGRSKKGYFKYGHCVAYSLDPEHNDKDIMMCWDKLVRFNYPILQLSMRNCMDRIISSGKTGDDRRTAMIDCMIDIVSSSE